MSINKTILLIRFITVLLVFISTKVIADAKVDGFFRESLIKGGFFENKPEINNSQENQNKSDSFFISREERRLNPEKAPSNSIKLPTPRSIRMRSRSIGFPGLWGSPVYSEGTIVTQ